MIQIGTFRFTGGGAEYQQIQRMRRRRWERRERHGRPPEVEDLGRDADTIRLTGSIWVERGAQIDALAALADLAGMGAGQGAATVPVFAGGESADSGEYLGRWVITELDTTDDILRLGGIPALISFEIGLLEAGV